jgi:hypothetical protein
LPRANLGALVGRTCCPAPGGRTAIGVPISPARSFWHSPPVAHWHTIPRGAEHAHDEASTPSPVPIRPAQHPAHSRWLRRRSAALRRVRLGEPSADACRIRIAPPQGKLRTPLVLPWRKTISVAVRDSYHRMLTYTLRVSSRRASPPLLGHPTWALIDQEQRSPPAWSSRRPTQ